MKIIKNPGFQIQPRFSGEVRSTSLQRRTGRRNLRTPSHKASKFRISLALAAWALVHLIGAARCQSTVFTYQGRVTDNGTNFTGVGGFKFALVTGTNSSSTAVATANLNGQFVVSYNMISGGSGYVTAPQVTVSGGGGSGATAHAVISGGVVTNVEADTAGSGYSSPPSVTIAPPPAHIAYTTWWSNDGTSSAGGEPSGAVTVPVNNGLVTVTLGDTTLTNMLAIDASLFTQQNVQLRIWFNDGVNGFAVLDPPQSLTPTPYSVFATGASNLLGTLPTAQLSGTFPASQLSGTVANTQLASNSITIDAGAGLSGGGAVALGGSATLNNAGVTSLTGGGGVTVSAANGSVTLGSSATDADIPNAIVSRDGDGSFTAGSLSLAGNLSMPSTTASNGIIFSGGVPLIHSYGTANFFAGPSAGNLTISGKGNSGLGYQALSANTNGYYNTAVGSYALRANTTGSDNTAMGYGALGANASGFANTACGRYALGTNTSGFYNAAMGWSALYFNANGYDNTAMGSASLEFNTSGNENIALGHEALFFLTTGSGNIAIGDNAASAIHTGNNNIDIGNAGYGDESGVIRIGTSQTKAVMVGIFGGTIATGATPVYVNPSGLLGTITSSARFKRDISSMGDASDVLLKLRPVTFKYKSSIDTAGTPQFGLIAEEVEKVDPSLIVRDSKGQPYSVRYEAVNAMLLNEFLKEHRKVEQQDREIQDLRQRLEKVEHMLMPGAAMPNQYSDPRN